MVFFLFIPERGLCVQKKNIILGLQWLLIFEIECFRVMVSFVCHDIAPEYRTRSLTGAAQYIHESNQNLKAMAHVT